MRIEAVKAREVLDSRGNPTVEAEVHAEGGAVGSGITPSGASVGALEALELRDGDAARFHGKGVLRAVANVTEILGRELRGMDVGDQGAVDRRMIELDGTPNKSRLGANAILAVSIACARCASACRGIPLYRHLSPDGPGPMPVPFMNVINGGAHASNRLDIQEFFVVPHGFTRFSDALRAGVETFHTLRKALLDKGLGTTVGDEGGFAPDLGDTDEAMGLLEEAIAGAGYRIGEQISLALDCAATELRGDEGGYVFQHSGERLTSERMADFLCDLADRHPALVSIEDGMAEDDWGGWRLLTARLGSRMDLVGDDVFVTDARLLGKGIETKAANAILVKPNQVGTLTETVEIVGIAREAGFATMISHRSGETEDTLVADLSVAVGAGKLKCGAPCRTDRNAKYNRLLRIEEELGDPVLARLDRRGNPER